MASSTATFTAILSSEYAPEAPLTAELGGKWANNLIASMQGASGAQRLFLGAFERVTAGATQRAYDGTTYAYTTTGSNDYSTVWEFGVVQGGTLRFSGQWRSTTGGTIVFRVQRVRAGVTVNTTLNSGTTSTFTDGSADIGCTPGDLFRFQLGGAVTGIGGEIRNLALSTDGEDLFPAWGAFGQINANTVLT